MNNARYKTHTGREFNMSAFAEKNGDTRVVGNVSMNARGDIIDEKGNVKIPTQTISRAVADIKNNESKLVSLKADESITPVRNSAVQAEETVSAGANIVQTREVNTINGLATEVEYADGSIQVIPKTENNLPEL
jgi:CxxC motif-containing protein